MLTIFIGAMEQKALGMALDFLLDVRITERQIIRRFNIIFKSLFSFFSSSLSLFLWCVQSTLQPKLSHSWYKTTVMSRRRNQNGDPNAPNPFSFKGD